MTEQEFHEQFPEEFDEARLAAHGAIMGWCGGKGERTPMLTAVLKEAYDHAFAEAFNAGVRVGMVNRTAAV